MSDTSLTFEKENFADNSNEVTNVFFPLIPGTQFVFEGVANRGGGLTNHQVIFTVTDFVRNIDGVNCVVVWDRDISDGVLQEAELAFFAQDKQGNVWNLAEYPEEYENGRFVGAPSTWLNGEADAQGGVHMLARPRVGTPPYDQGIIPSIGFHDVAHITDAGETITVAGKTYNNVLVTEEWNPAELPAKQLKLYAPHVGIVQIGAINDPEGETLNLVAVNHLNSTALQAARYEALKLEDRAYNISDLYQAADPALRFEDDGFVATLEGSSRSETLVAHNGRDEVYGYGGDDRLYGLAHDDSLWGGYGNDRIDGGLGADMMRGGDGNDTYIVDNRHDVIVEWAAVNRDQLLLRSSYTLDPSADVEVISVLDPNTTTPLTITGSNTANFINGNLGNNTINGLGGGDAINGGLGRDTLTGGDGNDRFVFDVATGSANADTIVDYQVRDGIGEDDLIALDNAVFTAFATGPLSESEFLDHIVQVGRNLHYDPTGGGHSDMRIFAYLPVGVVLTHSDFVVI